MTYLVAVEEPWTGIPDFQPGRAVAVVEDIDSFSCDILAELDGRRLPIEHHEGDPMEIAKAYIEAHKLTGKISRIEINLGSGCEEYVPERGGWKKIEF
jgi:hypothetical protein